MVQLSGSQMLIGSANELIFSSQSNGILAKLWLRMACYRSLRPRKLLHLEKVEHVYTFLPVFFNDRSTRFNISDGEIESAPARLKSVRNEGLFSPLSNNPM